MDEKRRRIQEAFLSDGYEVTKVTSYDGQYGFVAEHGPVERKLRKKVLYVEGDGRQMGYLIGRLAGPDVYRMTNDYVNNIIPAWIDPKLDVYPRFLLMELLMKVFTVLCNRIYRKHPDDIPKPLDEEMHGIAEGCQEEGIDVSYDQVLSLNVGIDCLLAGLFGGKDAIKAWINSLLPEDIKVKVLPRMEEDLLQAKCFRVPFACNAFAAFGKATDGKFYFGRDFMFPAAGVFQDTACLIIYNPKYELRGQKALPLVSQSAPGFVGSVVAMNTNGVGIGTHLVPSGNCDPDHPGLNSLLMVRYAGHCGYNADHVVNAMAEAQRGVSWIYPVGDGGTNRAVIIEAGINTDDLDPLTYPEDRLKQYLPPGPFQPSTLLHGLFPRWTDHQYPNSYLDYNPRIFREVLDYPYIKDQFYKEDGYLNANWRHGLDKVQYFAPQRETRDDLVLATNSFIIPEMRLCAMGKWTNEVAKDNIPSVIWRYDELNSRCLNSYGKIDETKAKELIDFLAPIDTSWNIKEFYDYYCSGRDPTKRDPITINGSVSLCNLTDKTIDSHFGYYDDPWVKLSLMNYVDP